MEHHKEAAKHDGPINFDDKESDERRKTRVRNRFVEESKEEVNEKADAFIKNFRNQLKIQREDSLKRFQEMISRGRKMKHGLQLKVLYSILAAADMMLNLSPPILV
ncbi:unnamed protein product [Dovyalis caffra]|uniref:Uncharacterized protein n=1 Tax=Dovyalis caffra TaxID=77055 RepID=A0AAV1RV19_9ROSI|nr:unnamed protein product [Dovyalis caffra]